MTDEFIALEDALRSIAETGPLVVSYTNAVTIDSVANTTLQWGGLPVMSADEREAADMLGLAGACLINMGTVNETTEELMLAAGRAAAELDVPVVFDPVGAGATPTRTRIAERITTDVSPAIIKGNYGEITALTGDDADVRGVESVGEYAGIAETAIACARATDAVVVASGATDIIATRDRAYELTTGHELMGQFVGSGCMLGVTLATFVGGLEGDALQAAAAGTTAYGLVGERTAEKGAWNGPASYETAFLDTIANLEPADLAAVDMDDHIELSAEG